MWTMSEREKAAGSPARPPAGWIAGILVFAAFGAVVSGILIVHHRNPSFAPAFVRALCGTAAGSGCDLVNHSPASRLLGIPVALWGFWFYGALAMLAATSLVQERPRLLLLALPLAGLGLLADLGLFAYSIGALGTLCSLCALTYGATVLSATCVLAAARSARRRGLVESLAPRLAFALERREALALVFGLAAVISGGGLAFTAGRTTAERCAELVAEPDEALTLAWTSFRNHYAAAAPVAVDTSEAPVKGTARALLELVLFADFRCPHCRHAATALGQFVERRRDKVRLAFKHYPLERGCNEGVEETIHPGSCILAKASLVAQRENRFWTFHDRLFASQERWKETVPLPDVLAIAKDVGLDPERLEQGLADPALAERLRADVAEANALEIPGVPALFANGRRLKSIPLAEFLEELLREIAAGRLPGPAPSASPAPAASLRAQR
jgi:protein-disulfide isomerase/uncharacterized membrane protein